MLALRSDVPDDCAMMPDRHINSHFCMSEQSMLAEECWSHICRMVHVCVDEHVLIGLQDGRDPIFHYQLSKHSAGEFSSAFLVCGLDKVELSIPQRSSSETCTI